jgi:hypothetical protein
MWRVPIRSSIGNVVLGILGVVYCISATATLLYYVATTWGAMGLTDYILQLALLASAIGGLFFVAIAVENLKLWPRGAADQSRSARDHQRAAATGS